MTIRFEDDGSVWIDGIPTPGEIIQPPTMTHKASATELIQYAAEILATKEVEAAQTGWPWRLKVVIRALVKTINLRLPVGQKITEAELKAAIREELWR
jgi:hypothetical protein